MKTVFTANTSSRSQRLRFTLTKIIKLIVSHGVCVCDAFRTYYAAVSGTIYETVLLECLYCPGRLPSCQGPIRKTHIAMFCFRVARTKSIGKDSHRFRFTVRYREMADKWRFISVMLFLMTFRCTKIRPTSAATLCCI